MKTIIILAAIILAGCATSTGVVPAGQDTYLVSIKDNGPNSSLGGVKVAALAEARDYCANKMQDFQLIDGQDVPRSFGQFPESSIRFRCVPR